MADPESIEVNGNIIHTTHSPEWGDVYSEIRKDGAVAAACGTYNGMGGRFTIEDIAVPPQLRGQGIGRVLFDHMFNFALRNRFHTVGAAVSNERIAKMFASFPAFRLTIDVRDGGLPSIPDSTLDPGLTQALLEQYRAGMPAEADPADELKQSVHYELDLR